MNHSLYLILLKFWFPVFIYSGIIFFLSSIPAPVIAQLPFTVWDKLEHVVEYSILAVLVARALLVTHKNVIWVGIVTVFVCSLYGVSDEFHQSFVPGRDASVGDILADVIGSCLGAIGFIIIRKRVKLNGSH